jgi:hypothetical protein
MMFSAGMFRMTSLGHATWQLAVDYTGPDAWDHIVFAIHNLKRLSDLSYQLGKESVLSVHEMTP